MLSPPLIDPSGRETHGGGSVLFRYTILKKTASETKYNTGYNSRLGVKHFAVSARGVGQLAASSDVYLIFKHFNLGL